MSLKQVKWLILPIFLVVLPLSTHAATLLMQQTGSVDQFGHSGDIPSDYTPLVNGTINTIVFLDSIRYGGSSSDTLTVTLKDGSSPLDCTASATFGSLGVTSATSTAIMTFSGTQCAVSTLTSTYGFDVSNSPSPDEAFNTSAGRWVFSVYDGDPGIFVTHIISVTPSDGSTTATTTNGTLNATGYVSTDDYENGLVLRFKLDRGADQFAIGALSAFQSAFGNNSDIPISSAGYFNLSSTSLDFHLVGVHTLTTSIIKPYISLFGLSFGETVLVSTTTSFVVGTTTAYDNLHAKIEDTYGQLVSTSTAAALATCSPISFQLTECLSVLFIPTASQLSSLFSNLQSAVFQKAPWGYVYRFVTIMGASSTPSTSSLPQYKLTLPSNYPGAGDTLDLTPWNYLMGSSSMLGTATSSKTGATIKEIVEPGYLVFLLVLLTLAIVHDFMGIHKKQDTKHL